MFVLVGGRLSDGAGNSGEQAERLDALRRMRDIVRRRFAHDPENPGLRDELQRLTEEIDALQRGQSRFESSILRLRLGRLRSGITGALGPVLGGMAAEARQGVVAARSVGYRLVDTQARRRVTDT